MNIQQKEEVYRVTATRYNLLGHWYVGFDGERCSQMHTDDKKMALAECAWVWDVRKKKWIKKPKETM